MPPEIREDDNKDPVSVEGRSNGSGFVRYSEAGPAKGGL